MRTIGWHVLLLSVATIDAFQSSLFKNRIPSALSRKTCSPSSIFRRTGSTTTQLSAAAPMLDKWKLSPDGKITGIISGHPSIPNGGQVTTSVLANPNDATTEALVRTKSGSQYKLLTPLKPLPIRSNQVIKNKNPPPFRPTRKVAWKDEAKGTGLVPILGGAVWALSVAIGLRSVDTDKVAPFRQAQTVNEQQATPYVADPAYTVELQYLDEEIKEEEEKIATLLAKKQDAPETATTEEQTQNEQKAEAAAKKQQEFAKAAQQNAEATAKKQQELSEVVSVQQPKIPIVTRMVPGKEAPTNSDVTENPMANTALYISGGVALFVGGVGGGMALVAAAAAAKHKDTREGSVVSSNDDGGETSPVFDRDSSFLTPSAPIKSYMTGSGESSSSKPKASPDNASSYRSFPNAAIPSTFDTPTSVGQPSSPTTSVAVAEVSPDLSVTSTQSNVEDFTNLSSGSNKSSYSPFFFSKTPTAPSNDALYDPSRPQAALSQSTSTSVPLQSAAVDQESSSTASSGASYMEGLSGSSAGSVKASYSPFGSTKTPVTSMDDSPYAPPSAQAASQSTSSSAPLGSTAVDQESPSIASAGASYMEALSGSKTGSVKASYSPFGSAKTPVTSKDDSLSAPPPSQASSQSTSRGSAPVVEESSISPKPVASLAAEEDTIQGAYVVWCQHFGKPMDKSRFATFSSNYDRAQRYFRDDPLKRLMLNEYADLYSSNNSI